MTSPHREELIRALPYARRYARALTGSQEHGDKVVADALKAVIAAGDTAGTSGDARLALYGAVSRHFGDAHGSGVDSSLTTKQRQLLLLTALEEVRVEDAADMLSLTDSEAMSLLAGAREKLRAQAVTDVLIIEDEPIIAMDIEELVIGCGHRVVGIAANESDAVAIAARERPGLILADINLGAGGDGTHAVARILRHIDAPVIFVTAYPERLLTGEGLEPSFVITKPFEPLSLAIATFQAVSGGMGPV